MRIIMHLDMDAFFAAIEERENPAFKGKPIVVGADPKGGRGRGVVSTANYAARKFGVRSAMPISYAWKLCPSPKCVYLPVDGKLYGIVSDRIMKIVREMVQKYCHSEGAARRPKNPVAAMTGFLRQAQDRLFASAQDDESKIEQVSVDEAYVDISYLLLASSKLKAWEKAKVLAQKIKREILKREKLTCSVGIGPNKLIAKIASDFQKPDSLTVVKPERVQEFLDPMAVRKLPGIGPKTEAQLLRQGIRTVEELRKFCHSEGAARRPKNPVAATTGSFTAFRMTAWWQDLCFKAHGIDNSPVLEEYEVKSLGRETTFEQDTRDQSLLTRTLMELCDEVMEETQKEGVQFRTVTVRVRFENFETHTAAHTLRTAARDGTLLKSVALKLLFPYFGKKRLIRLIGVRVSNFM